MEYQRKNVPFLHRGMNWNSPPEKIPDGQICYGQNVRVEQQGIISTSHGHTLRYQLPGYQYIHSISRLNITNPDFDPNFRRNFVVGADHELFVFQDAPVLASPTFNPVTTPNGQFNEFSGNPLSIIDAQPIGAAAAWKYIGDSKQMVTVGYYPFPEDRHNEVMARALTVGLRPPVNLTQVGIAGAGNLNGDYQWMFVYRRVPTGARSNPSAATRVSATQITTHMALQAATMTLPEVPIDPQTAQPDTHVVVDVYRFGGLIFRWALVGSGAGGSTFVDNRMDIELLAAPTPSQITDPATGLTRFNLFQPFVTQDIHRENTGASATLTIENGVWVLTDPAGPFKPDWLQGSSISIDPFDGTAASTYTIYQVRSTTQLELSEDASDKFTDGEPVHWSIEAGTLMSGQPLPHLWGTYGIGQSASYVFACGDPNAPGTLYWTNGNDPDSTDVVNSIVVTSPSEKLMTGCIYDGQPFCWSTERQFQIFPSLTIFGQFTTQEVAGAKGVWLEWSLSVQSNGLADQSVTWRGKDGIYDWSGGGLRRLSDDLYPFFPHDGEVGFGPETLMPFLNRDHSDDPVEVGNIDDTQPKYHRTCWFHGMLFYDFVAQSQSGQTYSTLVWDDVQVKGWVSLDQPFDDTHHPVARGIEIGANDLEAGDNVPPPDGSAPPMGRGGNLKVSWADKIFDYYGYTRGYESRVVTKAEDYGDSRANKLFGDYWFDSTPGLAHITTTPLVHFHNIRLPPNNIAVSTARFNVALDFHDSVDPMNGIGVMDQTIGLDIRWIAPDGQFASHINQWSPSYVMKPESISFRFTDRSDEGIVQAKYLMGFNMEANTLPSDRPFVMNVMVDGNLVGQVNVQHDGQLEKPYAFEPVAGYEFQIQMNFPQDVTWQLYKVRWLFEPWPDAVARKYPFSSLGETGAKFIQGVVLPMETNGETATVGMWFDDTNQTLTWDKSTLPLKKTGVVLDMSQPIVAHFIQFETLTPHRIWPEEAKVVWEPIPELTNTWQTQETDHDLATWHHLRDAFIAYMGGNGTPTLSITDEYETIQYTLDPVTPGQFVRCYRVLKPMKAKWHSYRIVAPGGIRLYVKDTAIRLKEWGSMGPYLNVAPFGDNSRVAGARI